jgi:lysophospholipase L1-like esterase
MPCIHGHSREITMLGLGDSIGEGVQSADANYRTQPSSYLALVADHLNVSFPLPWITVSPRGVVDDTIRRSRVFPYVSGSNLAVSGATVRSLLRERADAPTPSAIDSETELVLFPRKGSQVEIAESVSPFLVLCWIGNNDILSAALAFDQLDASQLTPVAEFEADFAEIVQRLHDAAEVVVYANIPDITNIGFLVDRLDLIEFLGSDLGLPEGEYTTIVAMFLIKLGFANSALLENDDFVLDAQEVQIIQDRTAQFNRIIAEAAMNTGMPVVDAHTLFKQIRTNPPLVGGVPITPRFLGGLFSLDGVHPSDTGHAIMAEAAIQTMNSHFGTAVPPVSAEEFADIFYADPFVDKDGDGKVTGRYGAGLLETLAPLLGISGDRNDFVPDPAAAGFDAKVGNGFLERYLLLKEKDPRVAADMSMEEVLEIFRDIFVFRSDGRF